MSRQQGNPPTNHTIERGDTLFDIAQAYYGDGNQWYTIAEVNPDLNPNNLQIGQRIHISRLTDNPNGENGFTNIVSFEIYEDFFPYRDPFYAYDSFVEASLKFPKFCNEGSDEQCIREAAAFLAHINHETGGLKYLEETTNCNYINTEICRYYNPDQTYHGRGPIQLSWNYNYYAFGEAFREEIGEAFDCHLIEYPELVSEDNIISFMSALWYWMKTPARKSCHDAIIDDSNFGMTIQIINGGIECGQNASSKGREQAQHRIDFYLYFCEELGVSPGENLYC